MKAIKLRYNIGYETNIIKGFTSLNNIYGGREYIFEDHPPLEYLLDNYKGEDSRRIIRGYLIDYYNNKKVIKEIETFINKVSKEWCEIEPNVLGIFEEIFETNINSFPKATAYVGSISIYPRDIENNTFLISFKQPIYSALKTILHEYTHFIYFDRWKKLFPKDCPQAYGAPNKLWYLSEILAVVIDSDERFLKFIPDAENQDFYFKGKSFYNILMPKTNFSIIGFYKRLYLNHKEKGTSIDEFLKDCRTRFLNLNL